MKRTHDVDDDDALTSKRRKCVYDIYRTGAKSVEGLDPQGAGADYHAVGVVRTKPGEKFKLWSSKSIQSIGYNLKT